MKHTQTNNRVRTRIEDCLVRTRLAMAGVSRNGRDFSRALMRDMLSRGYDVQPVNLEADDIEGRKCSKRVQEIDPPVEWVLVMTPPGASVQVVRDCLEAGIRRVWLHRGAGQGAVVPEAVRLCEEAGVSVIPGYCPYLFLPKPGFVHSVHRGILRLLGAYPSLDIA